MFNLFLLYLFETALYNDVEKLKKFIGTGHTNDVDATGNYLTVFVEAIVAIVGRLIDTKRQKKHNNPNKIKKPKKIEKYQKTN